MALENGVATLKQVVADKFTAKEMCLEGDDGETVCVTKNQLKGLLNGGNGNGGVGGATPSSILPLNGGGGDGGGSLPISGCLDSQALNFDPAATVDSGDCLYPNQGPGESIEVEPTAGGAISAGTSPADIAGNAPVEFAEPATGDAQITPAPEPTPEPAVGPAAEPATPDSEAAVPDAIATPAPAVEAPAEIPAP